MPSNAKRHRPPRFIFLFLTALIIAPASTESSFADLIFVARTTPRRLPPPISPLSQRRESETPDPATPVLRKSALAGALTLYSIGEPTDEEQLYLEFINRARANPTVEGERFKFTTDPDILEDYDFFGVDLDLMASQFAALSPAPPVSLNANLTAAARLHSRDMLDNQFQGHAGTDGSTINTRISAQSYNWSFIGENVFSSALSPWHGHAAFNVDWGGDASTGGMQNPPGHRRTIHEAGFKEVGIGVINGTNGTVGPQLVTQDFASRSGLTPLITGVAFYDFNGNNFYDPGEGIGGVTIKVAGAKFYAVSAVSGGYSVPVPASGTYTATFALSGSSEVQKTVVVSDNNSVKVDFIPSYNPPLISGPDNPALNQINTYQFTPVGGATGYQWKQNRRLPVVEAEGAENGLTRLSVQTSAGYDVIDDTIRASGRFSFHLAHPQPEDQVLTLNRVFTPKPTARLVFSSRLGIAGKAQTARAEISSDGGKSWRDVWNQTGTEDTGQSSFARQTISLNAFAGAEIMVRFRFDFTKGTFFDQTGPGTGFYIDDVVLTDTEELLDERIADISAVASFGLKPVEIGDYSLRVRAKLPNRLLPWGPAKPVTAQAGQSPALDLRITALRILSANQVQIDFEVSNASGAAFELQTAANVAGPWASDTGAAIQILEAERRFRANTSAGAAGARFYRVRTR